MGCCCRRCLCSVLLFLFVVLVLFLCCSCVVLVVFLCCSCVVLVLFLCCVVGLVVQTAWKEWSNSVLVLRVQVTEYIGQYVVLTLIKS